MWKYNNMPSPDELYHHGILGMKWGVRRYQNPDGTLTPAGKKRYAKNPSARNLDEKKAAYKAANKAYNKSFSKAYDKAIAAYSPFKKHRLANDERWADASEKLDVYKKARSEYKDARVAYAKENGSLRTRNIQKTIDRLEDENTYLRSEQKNGGVKTKKGKVLFTPEDIQVEIDINLKTIGDQKVALAKSKFIDELNAGESAVGRIWNKFTGADKIQANLWYNDQQRYSDKD